MAEEYKKNKKIAEKILKDIYTKGGRMPDFHRIEIKKEKRTKMILILLIIFFAFLSLAAWAGFFVFKPYLQFGGKEVKFEIRGPDTIVSGKEVDLDVLIVNDSDVPVAESSVFLILPAEFSLIKSDPAPQTSNNWLLGTLGPGDKHQIKLKGVVIKDVGQEFILNSTLTYKPANFNSEFQNVASYKAAVSGSVLETAIETPAETAVGEEVVFKIKYRNAGEVRIDGAALHLVFPEQFIFSTSTLGMDKEGKILIEKLEPQEENYLEARGMFSTAASDSEQIISQIGFWRENKFILGQESAITIAVTGSNLLLDLTINGGQEDYFSFGEPIYGAIKFKNISNKILSGVVLSATVESQPSSGKQDLVNWSTFKEPFGAKRDKNKIIWDASSILTLSRLEPNDEGSVDFSFYLTDKPFAFENRDYKIIFYLEASVSKINNRRADYAVQSQKLIFPILTDLSFKASARYFNEDNIALGSGPLPPKVGERTTYRVSWIIKNSLHDLTDITVRAKLPKNISFGPRSIVSVGTLSHSDDEVVWRIENLSSLISQAEVSFDLGIIPQPGDVGLVLKLLEQSDITAKDAVLEKNITLTADPITTEIPEDEEGRGKGVVVP